MANLLKLPLLSLLAFLLAATAAAETSGDEVRTFIVHVHPRQGQAFATAEDRTAWYRTFLPEGGRLLHAYHHVASGFAARLSRRELDGVVSAMPGFVSAAPDQTYALQTTHTPQFLGLNVQQGVWNYTSDRGAGVIVGVLDTGIHPDHPSFSGDGMPPPPAKWKGRCDFNGSACNNKLIGARDFVVAAAGAASATIYPNGSRVPPVDEIGHGTHTASTVAGAAVPGAQVLGQAMGVAAGMAPRAHIAVYKVCSDSGCSGSDILAGIDAAVADGCDIISMSLGGESVPFHQDPIAIGTLGAIEKGVFVSMAAGNSGPGNRSLSNEAPWMLTVAASTMDRSIRATVQLGNGLSFQGQSVYQPKDFGGFYPLVYAGASGNPAAEFCVNGSLDGFDVRGKIVLCEFGIGNRISKGKVVQSAGGVGMILANGFPQQGYDTLAEAHVLPASHVDYADGLAIKSYINSTSNATAQIVFEGTILGTSPVPSVVFFSSRGPNSQDPGILKPDITGPGVNVLAAWPFPVGPPSIDFRPTFNIISGTSMSTPHLSGIAAFIKSEHPDWSPAAIKSAIMTSADVDDRSGNPLLDEQRSPASFFASGAGHVNPEKAVNPGLVYDIDPSEYIGYLCGMYTSQEVTVIARRSVNCAVISAIPSGMLNYPSISFGFRAASKQWAFIRRRVKNVGEVPSRYYAAVDMPEAVVGVSILPDKLEFTEANQEKFFMVIVWTGHSDAGVVQGALRWVSETHTVRSPISITFA